LRARKRGEGVGVTAKLKKESHLLAGHELGIQPRNRFAIFRFASALPALSMCAILAGG
jgi:hypothetical protein